MADYYIGDDTSTGGHTFDTLIEVESSLTRSAALNTLGVGNVFLGAQSFKDESASPPGTTANDDVVWWEASTSNQGRTQINWSNQWVHRVGSGGDMFGRCWYTCTAASTLTFDIRLMFNGSVSGESVDAASGSQQQRTVTATGPASAGELMSVDWSTALGWTSSIEWDQFGFSGTRVMTDNINTATQPIILGVELIWHTTESALP